MLDLLAGRWTDRPELIRHRASPGAGSDAEGRVEVPDAPVAQGCWQYSRC